MYRIQELKMTFNCHIPGRDLDAGCFLDDDDVSIPTDPELEKKLAENKALGEKRLNEVFPTRFLDKEPFFNPLISCRCLKST